MTLNTLNKIDFFVNIQHSLMFGSAKPTGISKLHSIEEGIKAMLGL